ncbi:MAG: hypothetical protein OXC60_09850 [Litoreibacter sp.]|nr:hypothetical protein [Litoreibacter sp.]MCY4334961.1 hypothetical protein [Litoreibacter sp.]
MTNSLTSPRTAAPLTLALLVFAFALANYTQDMALLSLTPPPTDANPNPGPDVTPDRVFSLYLSAYTAWAALILLIPAYVFVWFQSRYQSWLAFWAASYVAYVVHLYISAFWFFEGDFTAMTTSSRVSAFWPGMVILVWWGVDVLIGLALATGRWVTIQRVIVHLLVFVLFVGGSAVKGETTTIQLMGWAFFGAGVGAMVVYVVNRRKAA